MLKKVAYVIAEAGEAGLRQAGWRAGESDSRCRSRSPEAVCFQKSLCLGDPAFSLTKPSTACVRPTHSMQGHLLCSESTGLNVNPI